MHNTITDIAVILNSIYKSYDNENEQEGLNLLRQIKTELEKHLTDRTITKLKNKEKIEGILQSIEVTTFEFILTKELAEQLEELRLYYGHSIPDLVIPQLIVEKYKRIMPPGG